MEQTINYRGYTINIVTDNDPMNPRTEWDNAGVMCCWHSRYNLGDMESNGRSGREHRSYPISKNYSEPIDLLYELAGVDRSEYQDEQYEKTGSYEDMDTADLYKLIEEKGTIIKSLYLYDHSGITISTSPFSCGWDSGQVGYIYMTKEKMEEEGWTKEQADKYLEGAVETYDNFLTGEVYGYRITKYNEEIEDDDDLDSCWGYYGEPEESGCIDDAKGQIDWYCERDQEKYEKEPKKKSAELYTI